MAFCNEALEVRRCRRHAAIGVTHHALCHHFRVEPGVFGQGAGDQEFRYAHPEAAADQLGQQKAALPVEHAPVAEKARFDLGRPQAAQRQQPLLDPFGQAGRIITLTRGQHMRNGFRQVAHSLVAFLEQPIRQAGGARGDLAQQARLHRLARLSAGQEIHGPGGVGSIRIGEIRLQRADLGVGGGLRVEFGIEAGEANQGGFRQE